jgi:hypothetical protein
METGNENLECLYITSLNNLIRLLHNVGGKLSINPTWTRCGGIYLWPQLFKRLRQEDHLSLKVPHQPGEHSKTPIPNNKI